MDYGQPWFDSPAQGNGAEARAPVMMAKELVPHYQVLRDVGKMGQF